MCVRLPLQAEDIGLEETVLSCWKRPRLGFVFGSWCLGFGFGGSAPPTARSIGKFGIQTCIDEVEPFVFFVFVGVI